MLERRHGIALAGPTIAWAARWMTVSIASSREHAVHRRRVADVAVDAASPASRSSQHGAVRTSRCPGRRPGARVDQLSAQTQPPRSPAAPVTSTDRSAQNAVLHAHVPTEALPDVPQGSQVADVAERVHALPEAVVPVGHQLALVGERSSTSPSRLVSSPSM